MNNMYMAECWYCGGQVLKRNRDTDTRTFHEECKEVYFKEKEVTKNEYVRLKIEVMFERALRMMEKQSHIHMDSYKEAAEAVLSLARADSTKFDSSHEMIAVMELINNEVKVKVQYPVNRKRVDILIPELKIALEVDGNLHKFRVGKDSERDIEIMNELNKDGEGWEVIRVPTNHIEKRVDKLIPAIKVLYRERKKARANHGGFIPSYYSRHNQSDHLKVLEGVHDKTKNSLKPEETKTF